MNIEPDGKWSTISDGSENKVENNTSFQADDEDDDLVEVQQPRLENLKRESTSVQLGLQSPQSLQSREPSSVPSAPRSVNNLKRPASQVIDLTGSDDDDDEPPRPAKRTAFDMPQRFIKQHDGIGRKNFGFPNTNDY